MNPLFLIPAAAGLGFLVYKLLGKDDDKPDELPTPTPMDIKPGPVIPALPGLPQPNTEPPSQDPPQAVTWDTNLWGGGSQPMKWLAIRLALQVAGWPPEGGTLGGDVNGSGCPEPGKGSRGNCTPSQQIKNFQAGVNRAIDKSKAGDFPGQVMFATNLPKLTVDGLLGANVLKAMKVVGNWQAPFGGGVFNPGSFRLATL